jgi:hypothetical protein
LNSNENKATKNNSAIFDIGRIIDDENVHEITLSYSFPHGIGKISTTNSVLGNPLDSLINKGNPIKKLVYLLYQERKNEQYYFLGTFILTEKRLLFFPAIHISTIVLSENNKLNQSHLNHLTLEKNLTDWHITVDEKKKDSKKKLNKFKTKKIDNHISLWFVMCISSEKHMIELPKELEIRLACSSSEDLKRRFMIIMEARRNCEFPITSVGSFPNKKYFLNFEFFSPLSL